MFQRANHTTPANLASRAASAPGQAESINSTDSDRRAAEWVLSIGGTIIVKENGSKRPIGVSGELSPGAFELTSVDLQHNLQVTDAELFRFQDCKNIEALGLSGTNVSDAGLGHFKDCKNLTSLQLESTRVSDAGLEYFKDCNNLTSLELNSSPVSDAGLVHFEDCKNLTYLGLGSTQVTDAGLKRLAAYPKLSHLRIQKTKVTAAGVKKLSAALSACKIEWDGGVIEPRTVWHGSAWDDLDPAQIPAAERVPRQPEGLVAVLGQHRRRVWSRPLSAAVSPDGNQYLLGTDDGLYLFDRDLKKPMRDLHPFIAESTATFLPDGRIAAFGQVAGKSSTQLQIFAKPRDNVPLEVESSTATNTVTGYRVPTASSDGRWLGVFDQGPSGSFELWKLNDALPQRAAKFTRHGLDNWLPVSFSPDANWFCYTDGNGAQSTIHLIDLRGDAPREAAVLKAEADEKSDAPAKGFYHAVFLADGRLATADRNGRTWFWKINDGEPQRVGSIRDAEVGEFLAASAKASRLVVSDGYTFRVWDLAVDPPKLLGTSSHSFPNDNIQNAAIAPDGNTVFTAHLNGAIRFWNVAPAGVTELDPLLPNPKRNDGLGQFKVLDRFLCSSTETQEVGVWQPTPTGLQSVSEPPPGHFLLGLLGKNSKQQQLIVLEPGGTGTLLFRREADQWKTIRRINGAGVHSAALNNDGRRIAIGRNNGTEFVVELWGWESEKQPARKLHEIKADSDFSLSQFAFAQEDRSLVVRHGFNVEVWDVQDDQLVPRTKLPPRQFHQIAVAPDGHTLATTASAFAAGHKLELWNLTTDLQQPTASFSLPNAEAVTFSPDGRRLAASFQESGTSAGVQIIQLATGTVEQRLTFPGAVHQLDFADDNRHLITANANGTIYVVRLAPPK